MPIRKSGQILGTFRAGNVLLPPAVKINIVTHCTPLFFFFVFFFFSFFLLHISKR
jgi:hypothetical protein